MDRNARWQGGTGAITAVVLAAVVGGVVLLSAGSVDAATVTVAAENYEYRPASRAISAGDVVRWTFAGDPHSVTSDTGLFDSGVTDPGGTFQFRFTKAGTYHYHCLVHPEQMFGTIVVEAATTPTATTPTATIPTATARPTPRPTARPTAQPTARPTQPRQTPSPTLASTPPPAATATPSPEPSASAAASQALLESPVPSGATGSPVPGAPTPTSATDATPIVVVVLVLGFLAGAGLLVARRRRPT